ncbi:MAG: hypothetical protein LDLANPLL_02847 [Turneriella sp.]|nr:hypothetical protein [Turneriella sp.]
MELPAHPNSNSRFKIPFIIALLCFIFYSGFVPYGKMRTASDKFNYHRNVALSFLQGKLDIACPQKTGCHDLARYNGRYYIYQPPVPALLMLPAVAIWGAATPDALIAAFWGSLNVFLFGVFLITLRRKYEDGLNPREKIRNQLRAKVSREEIVFMLVWGLGTAHYYMSMLGDVWHITAICGQTFLLAALAAMLSEKVGWRIGAAIFFALAVFTRLNLVMAAPFFAYFLWREKKSISHFFYKGVLFALPTIALGILYLLYNQARFGNMLELGVSYMKLEVVSGVAERAAKYGGLSIYNFLHNFYTELLRPIDLVRHFPFIEVNPHGFGLFWATPLFALVFVKARDLYRVYKKQTSPTDSDRFTLAALLTALFMAVVIFLIPSSGYMQFGARYTLDFQVFLFIAIGMSIGHFSHKTLWSLAILSMWIQFTGSILFLRIFKQM